MLKLIECPRDAMQGLAGFIPTANKIEYINQLLQVGFDTLDFGSFVSPKAIPQLRDTKEVIEAIDITKTKTKLLAIIGNERGATEALEYDKISYLGFPFSISDTFLKLNIKSNYQIALNNLERIHSLASAKNKEVVVYISMAFGNPYGDLYSQNMLIKAIKELSELGIKIINLADTVGLGTALSIGDVFSQVITEFPAIEFGLHLHTSPETYYDKIHAAYTNGCRRFDSVIMGLGGCPMSEQKLIGNLNTENLLNYFIKNNVYPPIDLEKYKTAQQKANEIFTL